MNNLPLDPRTGAVITIDYEHGAEIHGGGAYYIKSYVELTIGQYFDIQITAPNTTKWSHFKFELECEKESIVSVHKNVVITTPGTAEVPINRDHNSSLTSGMVIKSIINADSTDAEADTTTVGKTLLEDNIIGSGQKSSGLVGERDEQILEQAEDYSIRVIATVAGYTNYRLSWYEHTNKQN